MPTRNRPPRPLLPRLPPGGRRSVLALVVLLALGAATPLQPQAAVSKEYQLKAAFLFNFTKFVDWPAQRFADPRRPITLGVLGGGPFGDELNQIVRGQRVNGRAVAVANVATAAEARSVDLLFVSASAEGRFTALSVSLQGSGVLVVGESPGFIDRGGMIGFTIVADKVRFEINQAAAEEAGLKISTQLLKLATAVRRKL